MKLNIYQGGARYLIGGLASIEPQSDPIKIIDLTDLSDEDIDLIKKDITNDELINSLLSKIDTQKKG